MKYIDISKLRRRRLVQVMTWIGRRYFGKEFERFVEQSLTAEILAEDPTISMVQFEWPAKLSELPNIALASSKSPEVPGVTEKEFDDDEPWRA